MAVYIFIRLNKVFSESVLSACFLEKSETDWTKAVVSFFYYLAKGVDEVYFAITYTLP